MAELRFVVMVDETHIVLQFTEGVPFAVRRDGARAVGWQRVTGVPHQAQEAQRRLRQGAAGVQDRVLATDELERRLAEEEERKRRKFEEEQYRIFKLAPTHTRLAQVKAEPEGK